MNCSQNRAKSIGFMIYKKTNSIIHSDVKNNVKLAWMSRWEQWKSTRLRLPSTHCRLLVLLACPFYLPILGLHTIRHTPLLPPTLASRLDHLAADVGFLQNLPCLLLQAPTPFAADLGRPSLWPPSKQLPTLFKLCACWYTVRKKTETYLYFCSTSCHLQSRALTTI